MPRLAQRLDKPEYFFRPRQLLRRLEATWSPGPAERTFQLPWGLPLTVDTRDTIGRAVHHLGLYDLLVSEVLWRLLEPGEVALDVGANLGHMASVLAARAGPTGRVLAFEPHPTLHARLEGQVRAWARVPGCAPVEARAVALGDAEGEGHLFIPPGFQQNAGTASLVDASQSAPAEARAEGQAFIPVPVRTLDAQVPAPLAPAVMKLDVEGGEAAVLRGGPRVLAGARDVVFEDHGPYPSPPMRLLAEAGFTLYQLRKAFLGPRLAAPDAPRESHVWEAPSLLATRDARRAQALLAPRGWQVLRRPGA